MIPLVIRKEFYIKIIFVRICRKELLEDKNIKTRFRIRCMKGGTRWMNI